MAGLAAVPVGVGSVGFRFNKVRDGVAWFRNSLETLCNIGIDFALSQIFGIVSLQ